MKKGFVAVWLCCALAACGGKMPVADYQVVPLPQEIALNEGKEFVLNSQVPIVCSGDEAMQRNASFLAEYVKEALSPAKVLGVVMEDERSCRVTVLPEQLSLAIGKEGQNAKLVARLTGCKIDIKA